MTISNPGETPSYLATQQPPSATAQDGAVVVTATVSSPGLPGHVGEIQLTMSVPDAKHLIVQLREATAEAMRQQTKT